MERLREYVGTSLWVPPAVGVALTIAAALGLVELDRRVDLGGLGFSGEADSARSVLSTIAASMITLTGLVFSITIVALQLAAGQYSPRVMRTFLRDRTSKLALAAFVSTFTYALLVLGAVRESFVPEIAVALAILAVLFSVGMFVRYIDHIGHSIRVSSIVAAVGDETRDAIDRMHTGDEAGGPSPSDGRPRPPGRTVRHAGRPGVLVAVHPDRLTAAAAEADCVVELAAGPGAFVARGAAVARVHGPGELPDDAVLGCLAFARERTMQQDAAFGLRQLADIAERALSPSVNDPTTAVQALDQVHDLLRRLAGRPLGDRRHADVEGTLRVVVPSPSWEELLSLSVEEPRQYGAGTIQVARRLRAMLDDLEDAAPEHRRAAVRRQRELLEEAVARDLPATGRAAAAGRP